MARPEIDRRPWTTRDTVAVFAVVLLAAAYTIGVLWRRSQLSDAAPCYEIFLTEYPNLLYALRSMERGWGLLWNPMQNCGQAFLPTSLLGLFHPIHVLFLLFDIPTAYFLTAAIHLAVGGVGAYLLGRELGLGHVAALCGALAFELGGSSIGLLTWLPTVIFGIYVWIPWALFLCERILTRPTVSTAIALALVLTLQLLAGYPQFLLFTYQLIAMRVAWELLTQRPAQWRGIVGAIVLAFALPAVFGAVQLLPMVEYMQASVRDRPLTFAEMDPGGFLPGGYLPFSRFRQNVGLQMGVGFGTTFAVVAAALAAMAPCARRARVGSFYAFAAVLFLLLSFDTPLLRAYRYLPLGSTFRIPARFLYVSGFAFSVMVAFGVDAVLRAGERRAPPWMPIAAAIVGGLALWLLSPVGLQPWEWGLLGTTLVVCAGTLMWPAGVPVAHVAVPVLLFANLLTLEWRPWVMLPKDETPLHTAREVFAFVRERLTPQDRTFVAGKFFDVGLQKKSPTVYDIPAMMDHEPQAGKRYAELYVVMMKNREMQGLNDFYLAGMDLPKNRPLLNLMSTRYLLVADFEKESLETLHTPPLELVHTATVFRREAPAGERVRIYENTAALPRAFYVPRLELVANPSEALQRLASESHDPRHAALVEAAPRDGFLGADGSGTGEVAITNDRAETVVVHVKATHEGFLSLTDQYYPGWTATVNGAPVEIVRANHAFRAVRVPAGESMVVFAYRPMSVIAGLTVTGISLTLLAVWTVVRITRRRRA